MDGGGRVAEPLTGTEPSRPAAPAAKAVRRARPAKRRTRTRRNTDLKAWLATLVRWVEQPAQTSARLALPRRAGLAASVVIILSSIAYGTVRGDHMPAVVDWLKDVRNMAANAAGFRITGVALSGQKHLSREEVLAIAGVNGRSSLLFLDAADARNLLKANPWVADATVQKLFPDRLQITVTEREPFALWQKGGRVGVIATDGTVLESYVSRSVAGLPLVVGAGAETRAKDFLALIDRYPDLRDSVRAFVLVAERRWNLKLKNGVDVRLPETGLEAALDQLLALDREKKLLSRDIAAIDLRLPDRVTVRLSDGAAQAREELLKPKKPKPKGGNA
jgi:cell division protein FtsQ